MAPKGPKQGVLSFGPSPNSKRAKQADRMVARGEYATQKEALTAIYRKEYEARDAKKLREFGVKYNKYRRVQEQRSEIIDRLLSGDEDFDDAASDLWALVREYINTP